MASNKLKLIIALFVVGAFAYFLINDSFSMASVTDYRSVLLPPFPGIFMITKNYMRKFPPGTHFVAFSLKSR
jgi:hypothetical protein